MNKAELIALIAEEQNITRADAEKSVASVLDAISVTLAKGDDVKLLGFGNFTVQAKPERIGKNPRTGEALTIKASKAVKFAVGKGLKDRVNG
jgi:DNA-binding protein HU-beta